MRITLDPNFDYESAANRVKSERAAQEMLREDIVRQHPQNEKAAQEALHRMAGGKGVPLFGEPAGGEPESLSENATYTVVGNRIPHVQEQIVYAGNHVEITLALMETLEEELCGVLRPDPPTPPLDGEPAPLRQSLVPLASVMQHNNDKLDRVNAWLKSILARLEL